MPSAAASFLVNSLSMAGGGGEHVGADVRDAGHLQQALDGAVLAVRAVQRREHHVDAGERRGARRPASSTISPRAVGSAGSTTAVPAPAVISGSGRSVDGQLRRVAAGEHPAALAGDADRHHLELVRVERGRGCCRR